ncbi:MAG TPA: dienelactone hydrolase family protein [Natronosporangium sp.]
MTVASAVAIDAAGVVLDADLVVPDDARGVVLFAHGSGSSRHSSRNRLVAQRLHRHRFATVLADLLTEPEAQRDAQTAALRFDIGLLAERMTAIVDWAADPQPLPIGLFGASTGAAAALVAAADRPALVRAVVSRGGRPDLAADVLCQVRAPTLLIVGGRDRAVIELNRQAAELFTAPHQLHIVPGAGHLFEEPGALAEVADLATSWFAGHL